MNTDVNWDIWGLQIFSFCSGFCFQIQYDQTYSLSKDCDRSGKRDTNTLQPYFYGASKSVGGIKAVF